MGGSRPYMPATRLPASYVCVSSQPLYYIQAENSRLQTNDCSSLSQLATDVISMKLSRMFPLETADLIKELHSVEG